MGSLNDLSNEAVPHSEAYLQTLQGLCRQHDLSCQGASMRWRVWGQGPRVLLLHGGHGSWVHWIKNIEALATNFEVIVPDLPGFGDSGAVPGAASGARALDQMADCLVDGLGQLPGEGSICHVAAFSFGALVAARLACRMPGLQTLTLLGPAGHGSPRRQAMPLLKWKTLPPPGQLDALRRNMVPFMLHRPESVDELALACYAQACRATRFRSKGMSLSHDIGSALAKTPCSVRLLWGEADVTATPYEAVQRLSCLHHDCQWSVISNAGHWVQYEQYEVVNALLSSWWSASADR